MLFKNKITIKTKLEIKWKYRYCSISKAAYYTFWDLWWRVPCCSEGPSVDTWWCLHTFRL